MIGTTAKCRINPTDGGILKEDGGILKKLLATALAATALAAPMALAASTPAQAVPYSNCTQARDNGDCDIPSSSDLYQAKLDRDSDGIGCEC